MPKTHKKRKTLRRNRKGGANEIGDFQQPGTFQQPTFYEKMKNGASSGWSSLENGASSGWDSLKSGFSSLVNRFNSPQNQGYSSGQGYNSGGKKRGTRRGGAIPIPYDPSQIWSDMSKFPQAVGGRRTRRRRVRK